MDATTTGTRAVAARGRFRSAKKGTSKGEARRYSPLSTSPLHHKNGVFTHATMDTGSTRRTSGQSPHLATLETIYRAANRGRQGPLSAERRENRRIQCRRTSAKAVRRCAVDAGTSRDAGGGTKSASPALILKHIGVLTPTLPNTFPVFPLKSNPLRLYFFPLCSGRSPPTASPARVGWREGAPPWGASTSLTRASQRP
jgi:hypothetical protein